jgi:hypothetical protein
MISDILGSIRVEIATNFPDKTELVNPESIPNNPDQYLEDGYSVKMGSGSNDNLNSSHMTSVKRTIEVTLTKSFVSSDIALGNRKTAEADLINEMETVIDTLKKSPLVRLYVVDINYESDNGINLLEIKKMSILITKVSMIVRYKENY